LKVTLSAASLLGALALVGCGSASSASTNPSPSTSTSNGSPTSSNTRPTQTSTSDASGGTGVKLVGCRDTGGGIIGVDVLFPAGTPAKGADVAGAVYVQVTMLGPGGADVGTETVYATSTGPGPVSGRADYDAYAANLNGPPQDVTGCQIQSESRNNANDAPIGIPITQAPVVPIGTIPPPGT
jgi:hypothetical protein